MLKKTKAEAPINLAQLGIEAERALKFLQPIQSIKDAIDGAKSLEAHAASLEQRIKSQKSVLESTEAEVEKAKAALAKAKSEAIAKAEAADVSASHILEGAKADAKAILEAAKDKAKKVDGTVGEAEKMLSGINAQIAEAKDAKANSNQR